MQPAAKKKDKHFKLFENPRQRTVVTLNNILVTYALTAVALIRIRKDLSKVSPGGLTFKVPVVSGDKIEVTRDRDQILSLIDEARQRELIQQSIVSAVATVENYFGEILTIVLRWYPEKLATSPPGDTEERKVDLQTILKSKDLEDLLSRVIRRRIDSIFFESPTNYFRHIETILTFSLPKGAKLAYGEVKATRDILIHNAGVVNDTYLRKAGPNVRGKLGEFVPLDKAYLDSAISCMKRLIRHTFVGCLQKYGNVDE